MARPTVVLSGSPVLVVGQPAIFAIDVATTTATKVDFITAELVGEQGWSIAGRQRRLTVDVKTPRLAAQLMSAGTLPADTTTRMTASFVLPPGTAPTHGLRPAYSRCMLRIHISIPWHLDRRYDYAFVVHISAPRQVTRTPCIARSTQAVNEPRVELSLASREVALGEMLVGTCALFHLEDRGPREIMLSLVPTFDLRGYGDVRTEAGVPTHHRLIVPPGHAGTSVPFAIGLPRTLTPSFEAATHGLHWWLVARSGSFFGAKVEVSVPLQLVEPPDGIAVEYPTLAPVLADHRIAAVFASVVERDGWRHGTGDEQLMIERDAGDSVLQIAYSYRGKAGTFVVARVLHRSLGLGLSVTPSSRVRSALFADIEIDFAAWDRSHHVSARSADQAIPFLSAVAPALQAAQTALGPFVHWGDRELVYEQAITVIDEIGLAAIGARLEIISDAIAAARPAIPPPAIAIDLAAWRALATDLGGELTLGDLSISGELDGLRVEIALTWDAASPTAVHVAVGDADHASAELATPADWPADFTELHVAEGIASARYPLARPVIEIARVRALIAAMRAVLTTHAPVAGPYR